MTKAELTELMEDILSNKVDVEKATKLLYANKTKSWHTKEWEEDRSKVIKESCEQCGSKEILTIQHFWHPRNYGTVLFDNYSKGKHGFHYVPPYFPKYPGGRKQIVKAAHWAA